MIFRRLGVHLPSLGALLCLLPGPARSQVAEAPFEVSKHVVFDQLGDRHVGNLVYRRGIQGGRFVGWGRLPLQEWPFGSSRQTQVGTLVGDDRHSNGGTVLDIDGDGVEEVIVARGTGERAPDGRVRWRDSKLYWYREVPGRPLWEEHYIAATSEANEGPHDVRPYGARLASGQQVRGIVYDHGRRHLFFLEIPAVPTQPWIRHEIGAFPLPSQSGMEIVDVNGDGRNDIVSGMFWIEAPRDPRRGGWKFHRYGTWNDDRGSWGGMVKHAVADFDGDGEVEIVAAEAEIPGARLALFDRERADGTGLWRETRIDGDLYAPHSVVGADLDDDGRPDFVVGEMTAGGWDYPLNPSPKIYGYLNRGGRFQRHLIAQGWGVHEMRVLPERLDGDLVIYAADEIQPQKFDGMTTYLSYWIIRPRARATTAQPAEAR